MTVHEKRIYFIIFVLLLGMGSWPDGYALCFCEPGIYPEQHSGLYESSGGVECILPKLAG